MRRHVGCELCSELVGIDLEERGVGTPGQEECVVHEEVDTTPSRFREHRLRAATDALPVGEIESYRERAAAAHLEVYREALAVAA